jgi:hypothetical protein
MLRYAVVVAVIMLPPLTLRREKAAEQARQLPRQLNIAPTCANHSNISSDLCFIPGYAFAAWLLCCWPLTRRRLQLQSGTRQVPRQLDVFPPRQYAQIIPICSSIFVSYRGMLLLRGCCVVGVLAGQAFSF